MRYFYLLFFLLVGLHSHFVFAQSVPSCTITKIGTGSCTANWSSFDCESYGAGYTEIQNQECGGSSLDLGYKSKRCGLTSSCTCPAGEKLNTILNANGKKATSCIPDEPTDLPEECEHGVNPETGLCNNDDLCPSGKPKVNGQCAICPEYNEDGTCATPSSEPSASSSPDSGSAASGGSAGSAASTPSGGDDGDDGGDGGDGGGPGGGGGDGGNGGNNGGGGSAASASSASGAGASSGSNNSWNPYSGYGNWIPISENSPCPNKYQDISGQWWCAGGNSGNGTSAGDTASAGSAASASSAGECDPTSRDYLNCISSGKSSAGSVSSSSAASNSAGSASSMGEKGEFDGEDAEKKLEEIQEELAQKIDDIKAEIQSEFASAISGTGTIQDFCKNIRGGEVCFGMQKFESWLDPISQAIFLVACVLSFAIVLGGRN